MSTQASPSKGFRAVHVVWSNAASRWQVKLTHDPRVMYQDTTKDLTVAWARQRAMALKAELIVHNMDGTIGFRNSYGNDPFPPRG